MRAVVIPVQLQRIVRGRRRISRRPASGVLNVLAAQNSPPVNVRQRGREIGFSCHREIPFRDAQWPPGRVYRVQQRAQAGDAEWLAIEWLVCGHAVRAKPGFAGVRSIPPVARDAQCQRSLLRRRQPRRVRIGVSMKVKNIK